jgi:hypothetical protein
MGKSGLRFTERDKSKARRLYEWDGISQESIAEIIGCSRKSIENWIDADRDAGDPWVKGRYSQELLQKEEAAKVKAIEAQGWSRGRVLSELGIIAGSDIAAYADVMPDGSVRLKNIKQLGDLSRAIKSIKGRTTIRKDMLKNGKKAKGILEDNTLELVMHDKQLALRLIGQELGMFKTEAQQAMEAGIFSYYREQAAKRRGKA